MYRKLRVFFAMCLTAAQIAAPVAGRLPVASADVAAPESLAAAELNVAKAAVAPASVAEAKKLLTKENAIYLVRLQDNGLLTGRLRIKYPTGKSDPAAAKVVLEQKGKKIDWTQTDESGQFELSGVKEGVYIAKATIDTGEAAFNVRVLPFDAKADEGEMLLDATLTPTPEVIYDAGFVDSGALPGMCPGCDGCDSCGMVVEEYVEPMMDPCAMGCQVAAPCGGGFSGGGCCGGGGGFGRGLGLLGLGGLATGITALALRDDDRPPASPAAP
jgi:hypothetical protein